MLHPPLTVSAAALGAGALAVGAALPTADTGLLCPFRELTGIPCPLCGGTHAIVAAGHLDLGGVLAANWAWVLFALALIALAFVPRVLRSLADRAERAPLRSIALIAAGPWAVAVLNL